jgi:hypothetical protein
MTMTVEELKYYLAHNIDEVDILEYLQINAEDLVEAFHDKVEDSYDKLIQELELEEEDEFE